MRTSELLYSIGRWLESTDNEAMMLAEDNPETLQIVAESCILAAELIKRAADEVDLLEPATESVITPEAIEEMAALASAFDASGDAGLQKQASVLDELLLTIAAQPGELADKKAAENGRLEELRKKYEQTRQDLRDIHKIEGVEKAIEKSRMTQVDTSQQKAMLSARTCPEHPGAQLQRIAEHIWACELDKRQFNFETGFKVGDIQYAGGDVALQTPNSLNNHFHTVFDDRSGRLGQNS